MNKDACSFHAACSGRVEEFAHCVSRLEPSEEWVHSKIHGLVEKIFVSLTAPSVTLVKSRFESIPESVML